MRRLFFLLTFLFFYSCTSVDSLISEGKTEQAVSYCEKEETRNKQKKCYEKVADYYFQKGNFFKAERYYGEAYADNIRRRKKASFEIAEYYLERNNLKEALKYYEKTGRKTEGFLKVADRYLEKRNVPEAYKIYKLIENKNGLVKIADIYYKNGEYLRALKLYTLLNLRFKYAFKIARKLFNIKNYFDAALLFKSVRSVQEYKKTYKKLGYYLLNKNDNYKILNSSSVIVSILRTDDYIFAVNKKGELFQSYLYDDKFEKVISLPNKEKVYGAKYFKKNDEIVLLTNAGLVFYDIVTHKIRKRINEPVTAFAFSNDGEFLLTAKGSVISVRDNENFDELLFFKKHTKRVTFIKVLKEIVISAGKDKVIRGWNIETGEELFKLRGHYLEITSLILSKDGKLLISGGKDKKVMVWDIKSKKKLKELKFDEPVRDLALTGSSEKLIVALKSRKYKIINLIDDTVNDSALFHSFNISSVVVGKYDEFIYGGDYGGNVFVSFFDIDKLIRKAFLIAGLDQKEYFTVAEKYFGKKKFDISSYYYELSGKAEEGLKKIAVYYYDKENYDEALKYFKKLDDDDSILKTADIYYKSGDYNSAAEQYIRVKNFDGVLKCAEMFLYEQNYYDAIRLYMLLIKKAEENGYNKKISDLYIKLANVFMIMKESEYKGTEDDEFNETITEKLKKWYPLRFEYALSYYEKAGKKEEGALNIGKFLCQNDEYLKGISFLESIEKSSEKLIRNCKRKGGNFYLMKAAKVYKEFKELEKNDGDWDKIKESFKKINEFLSLSKSFFKSLKDYKKLRKINKIENKLRYYKRKLGL